MKELEEEGDEVTMVLEWFCLIDTIEEVEPETVILEIKLNLYLLSARLLRD